MSILEVIAPAVAEAERDLRTVREENAALRRVLQAVAA